MSLGFVVSGAGQGGLRADFYQMSLDWRILSLSLARAKRRHFDAACIFLLVLCYENGGYCYNLSY